MNYLVTVSTAETMYGKKVDSMDAVLEMVTGPEVKSYLVSKNGEEVSFAELASAWRHPARQRKFPPLRLP